MRGRPSRYNVQPPMSLTRPDVMRGPRFTSTGPRQEPPALQLIRFPVLGHISCAHKERNRNDFPVPVFPKTAICSLRLVSESTTRFLSNSPSNTCEPRSNVLFTLDRSPRNARRLHSAFIFLPITSIKMSEQKISVCVTRRTSRLF
jgi:hypothetical protein